MSIIKITRLGERSRVVGGGRRGSVLENKWGWSFSGREELGASPSKRMVTTSVQHTHSQPQQFITF